MRAAGWAGRGGRAGGAWNKSQKSLLVLGRGEDRLVAKVAAKAHSSAVVPRGKWREVTHHIPNEAFCQ